jgi:hypothetical protein
MATHIRKHWNDGRISSDNKASFLSFYNDIKHDEPDFDQDGQMLQLIESFTSE